MVPIADQHPRACLETDSGQDAQGFLGDVLESARGELDAKAAFIGGSSGALSRTRLSQLEVRDGLELGLWV